VWEKKLSGLAAGQHTLDWDGVDTAGQTVANGVYLVQVRLPTAVLNRRAVLLK
jgi:flagellar hook assembly protein FlgD